MFAHWIISSIFKWLYKLMYVHLVIVQSWGCCHFKSTKHTFILWQFDFIIIIIIIIRENEVAIRAWQINVCSLSHNSSGGWHSTVLILEARITTSANTSLIFRPRHTIVAGYYGFMLAVHPSVCLSQGIFGPGTVSQFLTELSPHDMITAVYCSFMFIFIIIVGENKAVIGPEK